jgi:hypothetical protein
MRYETASCYTTHDSAGEPGKLQKTVDLGPWRVHIPPLLCILYAFQAREQKHRDDVTNYTLSVVFLTHYLRYLLLPFLSFSISLPLLKLLSSTHHFSISPALTCGALLRRKVTLQLRPLAQHVIEAHRRLE